MAGNTGVLLLIVVLFFCCCLSSAGGGWWYYKYQSNVVAPPSTIEVTAPIEDTSNGVTTSEAPVIINPLPEVIKKWSPALCQSVTAIDETAMTLCTDGATASGVTWNWGKDPQSVACKNATKGYTVTATSSSLPDIQLKQKIKIAAQNTAGVSGMPSPWHQGNITFKVMPTDAKGKNIMQNPAIMNTTQATNNQSCKTAGVNAEYPVPAWNANKNLIGVKYDNNGGNGSHFDVWGTDDTPAFNYTSRTVLPFSSTTTVVPKGSGLNITCDGHVAGLQSWNNDNSWEFMIDGAAKKDYKWTVEHTCWSGNAKSGTNNFRAGW